ncbi:hypothetical protein Q428_11215 [Fervidicella metallireducens AeB]|uniref:Lipoprotein n=1 Tax=Fervidicella metallireducens AeB TaxID=1403537 RepID=A0A017RSU7_9CLOT|nr:hypothetical protein [Fervidicella metallireducens]EYE87833.1 hypothetical protein Q428_11215 [Fervidicella metallireducens AeB]
MKNKVIHIILISSLIVLFSSCKAPNDISSNTMPPENNRISITGEWLISKLNYSYPKDKESDIQKFNGKTAVFSRDFVIIGEEYYYNPQYSLKVVNADEYFIYQYKILPGDLKIENKKVQVITVKVEKQYLFEVIKLNEDRLIVNINGIFVNLNRLSKTTEKEISRYVGKNQNKEDVKKVIKGKSSVLVLGVAYKAKDRNKQIYKTFLFSSKNGEIGEILVSNDLIFPRKNGFWRVDINDENLNIYPLNNKLQGIKLKEWPINRIVFLGNDFISFELKDNDRFIYRNYPIDAVNVQNSVKISDLYKEYGRRIFYEKALKFSDGEVYRAIDESNFTLSRKSGHWILKGRVNNSNREVSDFNLQLIPSNKMVFYDDLCMNWAYIKSKIPEAKDAFTSPNGDIAVVFTPKEIQMYNIEGKKLSDKPKKILKINGQNDIIMAEWALGEYYVENWREVFLNNSARKVK